MSKIKPLHAEWLVKVYTDMQNRGSLIKKGFQIDSDVSLSELLQLASNLQFKVKTGSGGFILGPKK